MSTASIAARPALRITRRGRVVLGALLTLPTVAIAVSIALSTSTAPATATNVTAAVEFEHVTVQPGESLWTVAERVAPQADPREVISEIERLNGLESAAVGAGESLAIPAQYVG